MPRLYIWSARILPWHHREMIERALLDAAIARAVQVSPKTLAHARRLRAHSREKSSIGELLVDLEAITPEELERVVQAIEIPLDPEDISYITGVPPDLVRPEKIPAVTTAPRWTEEQLREHLEAALDHPIVRFANMLLIQAASHPGGCVRIEISDSWRVLVGSPGALASMTIHAPLVPIIWRIKQMAGMDIGGEDQTGTLNLRTHKSSWVLLVRLAKTTSGTCLLVRRAPFWLHPSPDVPRAYADALSVARHLFSLKASDAERAFRHAISIADDTGDALLAESARARIELADHLQASDRIVDARELVERALALAIEHEMGARTIGMFTSLLANNIDDPVARKGHIEHAIDLLSRPGVSRVPIDDAGITWLQSLRQLGLAAECREAIARLESDLVFWYGGPTVTLVAALGFAAHAYVDAGDLVSARALADRIESLGKTLQLSFSEPLARWLEGRVRDLEGHPEEAIELFERAKELEDPEIEADIAFALAHCGRTSDAEAQANKALSQMRFESKITRELQALVGRTGPYR